MKKYFFLILMFVGILIPLACSDNTTPTKPPAPPASSNPTSTPTGTVTPGSPTPTFTLPAGANTPTPTPTFVPPIPAFKYNYSTSAAPRGMVLSGNILTVAENEGKSGGVVSAIEEYTGASTGVLNLYNLSGGAPNVGNVVNTGCPPTPVPDATPTPFAPTLTGLQQVQGFINPGGNAPGAFTAVLDLIPGGTGAILYSGYYSYWSQPTAQLDSSYTPFVTTGYSGIPFNSPRGMVADQTGGAGHIYIADTGRGYVVELSPYDGTCPLPALPIHQWNGSAGVTVGGLAPGGGPSPVTFNSAAVSFKSPYAITCDTAIPPNVWVGDQGYSNSYIMEFTSDATTIVQSWQGISGCVVSGLAVDNQATCGPAAVPGPCVYVADSGNSLVEIYTSQGNFLKAITDPGPAAHEYAPFQPTCIAFSNPYIYVGDVGNDFIDVFQ